MAFIEKKTIIKNEIDYDKLAEAISKSSNINIDYIYVSFSRDFVSPLAVLKVNGYLEVESCLRSRGYKTV